MEIVKPDRRLLTDKLERCGRKRSWPNLGYLPVVCPGVRRELEEQSYDSLKVTTASKPSSEARTVCCKTLKRIFQAEYAEST
jgi:hypothetical protein